MDLKKYKRAFLFGCSFTCYKWPTWADIICHEVEATCYNYGHAAAGNQYIFSKIVEANITHSFNQDDLIMIMWSSIDREDRYIDSAWKLSGTVYNSLGNFYDDNYIKKYVDPRGFLIRDLTLITAASQMLKGLDYYFFSMVPLTYGTENFGYYDPENDVEEFFKDTLDKIKPSFFEAVFNNTWGEHGSILVKNHDGSTFEDIHPTPKHHLQYLNTVLPELQISQETVELVKSREEFIRSREVFDVSKYPYFARPYILPPKVL